MENRFDLHAKRRQLVLNRGDMGGERGKMRAAALTEDQDVVRENDDEVSKRISESTTGDDRESLGRL